MTDPVIQFDQLPKRYSDEESTEGRPRDKHRRAMGSAPSATQKIGGVIAQNVETLWIADCEVDFGKQWPLVPDGEYQALFIGHDTAYFGRSPKIYLHFRVIDPPDHKGKELFRAYPVKTLIGRRGRRGRFELTKHQLLFKTLCRLLDLKARPDRISLQGLNGRVLLISTRTVVKDYLQGEHPEFCRYSVVDDIREIVA